MGGKAFAHHDPPIQTLRLAPELYQHLRDTYISQLSTLFQHAACPLEAPGKPDHGDVDILVSQPRFEELTRLLGDTAGKAFTPIKEDSHPSLSIQFSAIKVLLKPTASVTEFETINLALSLPGQPNSHLQLDVHIVSSYTHLRWLSFQHSYGDFFSITANSLRLVGLVGNDKGFYARDAEIEPHDRKKCLVFLTREPIEVLDFLGLDVKHWFKGSKDVESTEINPATPFKDNHEIFTAISHMRFFRVDAYLRKDLHRADRTRLQNRNMYRSFVQEFLPDHVAQQSISTTSSSSSLSPSETRDQVFTEAMARWNARETWNKNRKAWEWERLDVQSRKKFKEKKKWDVSQACAYADAWIEWCGLGTGSVEGNENRLE